MMSNVAKVPAVLFIATALMVVPDLSYGCGNVAMAAEIQVPESETTLQEEQQDEQHDVAEDYRYTGPVDMNTGEPVENTENGINTGTAVVNLPDGGSYNRTDHSFVYTVSGQSLSLHSSIANNIITTEPVSLKADDGLDVVLYKNAKPQNDVDLSEVTLPGTYTVVAKGKETDHQILTFTIVTPVTGAIDRYKLPYGFVVTGVVYNDKAVQNPDPGTVDLTQEGTYHISYSCLATQVSYELQLEVDHTKPQFKLEGVKKGLARGPVSIINVAEDETVSVTSGDNEVKIGNDLVIRNVGRYKVTVTDKAGNTKSESFTIRMYLNYQGIIFFLLSFGIIAATVAYMVVSRKKLRIR
jgi:hypothetical protein